MSQAYAYSRATFLLIVEIKIKIKQEQYGNFLPLRGTFNCFIWPAFVFVLITQLSIQKRRQIIFPGAKTILSLPFSNSITLLIFIGQLQEITLYPGIYPSNQGNYLVRLQDDSICKGVDITNKEQSFNIWWNFLFNVFCLSGTWKFLYLEITKFFPLVCIHCLQGITGTLQGKSAIYMEKGCKNHRETL